MSTTVEPVSEEPTSSPASRPRVADPFHVTVAREALFAALTAVVAIVSTRSVLPVLSTVKLEMVPGGLRLTTTDLVHITSVVCAAEHDGASAAILAPAKKLLDIVREMAPGPLTLSKSARGLQIAHGRAKLLLQQVVHVSEFPATQPITGHEFTCAASVLHRVMDRVGFAVSTEESRPILNGVLLQVIAPDVLRAVATNGHRLALVDQPVAGAIMDFPDLIVTAMLLAQVRRIFAADEVLRIVTNGQRIAITGARAELIGNLVDGPYPTYKQILPTTQDKTAVVDCTALRQTLRRVATIANEQTKRIKLAFSETMLRLEATTADLGDAADELPVRFTGATPFAIGFNGGYLGEALAKLGAEEVEMSFTTPERATRLVAATPSNDGVEMQIILMPLRLE